MNGDVVVVQQKIDGIPVFGKSATFLMKNDKVASATNGFANSVISTAKIASNKASISAEQAFSVAATNMKLKNSGSYEFSKNSSKNSGITKLKSHYLITDELVYFIIGSEARLAHKLRFYEKGTSNSWVVLVDAHNSEVLTKLNTTVHDHFPNAESFLKQDYSTENAKKTVAFPLNKPKNTNATYFIDGPTVHYNVFAVPVESPIYGDRSIVAEPNNPTFAPLGWQNTNNPDYEAFQEYSWGNNAVAYSDPD